jgi:hypothetical protein
MNYVAQGIEHIVVKTEPWILIDLSWGGNLGTSKPFDVYTDRQAAIDAIKAEYPDFEPPDWEAPEVPIAVTMRQGRLMLFSLGLLDMVDTVIAGISDPVQRKAAEIEWEYAQVIARESPLVDAFSAALGLTDVQLDALFVQASKI